MGGGGGGGGAELFTTIYNLLTHASRGAPVAQWPAKLAVWTQVPPEADIFLNINGVPLHTVCHFYPSIGSI